MMIGLMLLLMVSHIISHLIQTLQLIQELKAHDKEFAAGLEKRCFDKPTPLKLHKVDQNSFADFILR